MKFIINRDYADGMLRDRMRDEGLPETLTHKTSNGYILYSASVDLLKAMVRGGLDAVLIHDVELYQAIFDRRIV